MFGWQPVAYKARNKSKVEQPCRCVSAVNPTTSDLVHSWIDCVDQPTAWCCVDGTMLTSSGVVRHFPILLPLRTCLPTTTGLRRLEKETFSGEQHKGSLEYRPSRLDDGVDDCLMDQHMCPPHSRLIPFVMSGEPTSLFARNFHVILPGEPVKLLFGECPICFARSI
eukprot:3855091-Amphidinium_carterae.1